MLQQTNNTESWSEVPGIGISKSVGRMFSACALAISPVSAGHIGSTSIVSIISGHIGVESYIQAYLLNIETALSPFSFVKT